MRSCQNLTSYLRSWVQILGIAAILAVAGGTAPAGDRDGAARSLLPDNPLAVIEIEEPGRLLESPLVRVIHEELQDSREVAVRMESPEFDRVRQAQRFLADAAGVEWLEAIERLTAGGLTVAVTSDTPPRLLAMVTASDAEFLQKFVAGTREQVLARVPEAFRAAVFVAGERQGHETWHVGQAWYAVVGKRLVFTNDGDLLHATLDRMAAAGSDAASVEPDAGPAANDASVVRVSLNLEALRKTPDLEQALKLPTENAAAVAFAGGWLDLLRHSDEATAELSLGGEAIELAVRLAAGRNEITDGLQGFFRTGDDERPLPLLEVPGTLYAATWFRDYASLWENRSKLLTEAAVQKMEEGDEAIRKQFSVFKVDYTPSDMFLQLGTQFRTVVARQQATAYRVELDDKLPAAALAVTLRDAERFAAQYVPLTRAIALIATFEQGITTRESEHRGAKLVGWWFRDDPQAVASGNRVQYNFAPTYSITRGHFIVGSTREIVEQVIEALDREAESGGAALAEYATERQLLSMSEVAAALRGIQGSFVRNLAIEQGLTVPEAEQEFDVLTRVAAAIGRVTTESRFTDDAFEYRLRIEPAIESETE